MNSKIKLLIHTQYYPPEIGAPQSRLSDIARELSKNGFTVTILTAMPNYPTGRIFPNYSALFRKEELEGITIYRSFIYPTQSANYFKRLLNYFTFVISSFVMGIFLPRQDYIFTESPPLFLGISGYAISRIKRSKWIFNVADLWPESVVELGILNEKGLLYKISKRMESFFYHKATFVTGQSKTILQNINKRFPKIPTYHLSNGVNPERYSEIEFSNGETINVMYAGLHGLAQGLDQILTAAGKLVNQEKIKFTFIGDGPEKQNLISQKITNGLSNVSFVDPIPNSEIPNTLASADILIIPLKIQLTGAVPSKLYEGMATGKPVILIAESEAAEIVRNADCGIVVKPGDINGLVSAITQLAEDIQERKRLGTNGRIYVINNYDRRKIIRTFANFLTSTLIEKQTFLKK